MTVRPMALMASLLAAFLALGMMLSPGFPLGYIYPLAWLVGTAVVWEGYRRYRLPGSKAFFLGFALLLVSTLVGSVRNLLLLMTATMPGVSPELAFRLFSPVAGLAGLPGLTDSSYKVVYYGYTIPVIGLPGLVGAILVVYGLWGIGQEAMRRRAES